MTRRDDRTELERSNSLTDMSASRLGTASRCGLAFRYQYVDQLPAPYDRGSSLLGLAVHNGLQEWYGPDPDPRDHRDLDLVALICAQWENLLPPVIWERVQHLRGLAEECEAVAAAVKFKRPQLKNPAQTKEYLESRAVREFSENKVAMLEFCDKLADVKWPKDEDPYTAYAKAAAMGKAMEARWKHLPRPLSVERPFRIEVEGFSLRGRIDQLRVDPNHATGEVDPFMCDVKTGRQALTQMEAFLQSFIYVEAIRQAEDLPDVNQVRFYLTRQNKYQRGMVDVERHRALASRILNGRGRQIVMGQFEPSYGMWCKMCDFNDLCSKEISLWEGDGIMSEPKEALGES